MKITQESDYALRIVAFLASTDESRVGANTIASSQEIPLRFALKILRKLNAAGITKAYRGVTGGYTLIKDPKDISYKEVIEAIEGDVCINRCLSKDGKCNRNAVGHCKIHKKLQRIQKLLNEHLANTRF